MDADLDTLATALYVRTDDLLKASPERAPWRPTIGIAPRITDAEMITLAVLQALLRFTSEAHWLRHPGHIWDTCSGICPNNPAATSGCAGWRQPWNGWSPHWPATPPCGPTTSGSWTFYAGRVWTFPGTAHRSDLAGYAEHGYCASHSPYLWGLRLHLIATLHGLPVGFALTGAKADEREVLLSVLTTDCPATRGRYPSGHRQIMIADKNYGHVFETTLREAGTDLLRPARKGERSRPR